MNNDHKQMNLIETVNIRLDNRLHATSGLHSPFNNIWTLLPLVCLLSFDWKYYIYGTTTILKENPDYSREFFMEM